MVSIFEVLATVGCVLFLWQWLAAFRYPLHRRSTPSSYAPGVTLLKPLRGADDTTYESLQSWFRQNYAGPIQIIFGVVDSEDPAAQIVRRLLVENPDINAQLVICDEPAGANAKVAKLAELEILATHDLILVSDADVRVPPDFLSNVVAPLEEPKNGLVCCFYRLANPVNTAMWWETVAVNADFWSQVLQSATLQPLHFALGAVMLVRRSSLEEIGGFAALANCLADDYQLGNRITRSGHRIALCPVVVECWDAPAGWRTVWKHQLRWARTIRVSQPVPYFFSILSNGSLWALALLFVSLVITHNIYLPMAALCFLFARMVLAYDLQRRFTPERPLISPFWLIPVKDCLNAGIWLAAFAGNTVEWRGRRMRLRSDGTLVEIG